MKRPRLWTAISAIATISVAAQACSPAQQPTDSATASQAIAVSANSDMAQASRIAAEALNPADASRLATADFANGQCKLYAVLGYAWSIPGKDAPELRKAASSAGARGITYRIVYVEGTSDVPTNPHDATARQFAKTYNDIALKNCGEIK